MTEKEISQMSDARLLEATEKVAASERRLTVDLLALLIEVERRGVHLAVGCSSLFAYCTQRLRLSEQSAYSRITAARAAGRFPALLEMLADGVLSLSSVAMLAPRLNTANHDSLLRAAAGKSTREVRQLIAFVHPQPDVAFSLRRAPSTTEPGESPLPRPVIAPLSPTRYLLKMTIGQETQDKLQRARDLLRHAIPDGDPAAIIDRALTLLIERTERAKHGGRSARATRAAARRRPRVAGSTVRSTAVKSRRGRASGYIPADVRREVWKRDRGRCAFKGSSGRCRSTAFLEFHHVVPFSMGGPSTPGNLQLRCRAHNAHEADRCFGVERTNGPPAS